MLSQTLGLAQNKPLLTTQRSLKTQNSKLKTQNSKLKTQNPKLKYPLNPAYFLKPTTQNKLSHSQGDLNHAQKKTRASNSTGF